MIKELMHDPIFLAGKSEIATKEDLPIAQDLLDTLMAHKETCVGMAANMIGVKKRIIAFLDESGRAPVYTVMLNPEIIKKDDAYDTEEGCLSLLGDPRKCKRYLHDSAHIASTCFSVSNRLKSNSSSVETPKNDAIAGIMVTSGMVFPFSHFETA